jgi:hypothetical protein
MRKLSFFLAPILFVSMASCSRKEQSPAQAALPSAVSWPHSPVKRQSIETCWIYAGIAWIESLNMQAQSTSGEAALPDYSEAYLTLRFFEHQLSKSGTLDKLETLSHWGEFRYLVQTYGLMHEKDFRSKISLSDERTIEQIALEVLNESLANGPLKSDRSNQTIRKELDRAFGVDSANLKVIKAWDINVRAGSRSFNLESLVSGMQMLGWDKETAQAPAELPATTRYAELSLGRKETLKRVMRALNAGFPILVSWFVDLNAVDASGTFQFNTLRNKGKGTTRGFHQSLIVDYSAQVKNPRDGTLLKIQEGAGFNPELLSLAAENGELETFIIKNSWGTKREDRPLHSWQGNSGYHVLDASYLFSWLPLEKSGIEWSDRTSTLIDFIIPQGY